MSVATRRALYGKLSGDTTLTNLLATPPTGFGKSIYYQQAPDTAKFPLVIFSKSSGVPTEAFHNPTAFDTDVWLIKGIDQNTTADTVEAISDRLRVLLNDASLSVSGATVVYLRRQSDVDYAEPPRDGLTYLHSGSLFRLVLTS